MLDSRAWTKLQIIILISTFVVAGSATVATYVLLNGQNQSSETIKIGILADLDYDGKYAMQEATLAAEQLNAEGGILGRQIELIGEDSYTSKNADLFETTSALTRLITYHKVDFIFSTTLDNQAVFACQDIIAEHKKILFAFSGSSDDLTQRVLDDYDKYKYFFSCTFNTTSTFNGMTDSLLHLKQITGFTKVGYLAQDLQIWREIIDGLDDFLPKNGLDPVYRGIYALDTVDFTSYFASAEAAGVEILLPMIVFNGVPVINEYYARQSPMVIYGGVLEGAGGTDAYAATNGRIEDISVVKMPINIGYPLTNKTLATREAYFNRWNELPSGVVYDVLRYILPDAIERAGTIETEAVVKALEKTSIEVSNARNWVWTKSHAIMFGGIHDLNAEYMIIMIIQWQDGEQVPVFPQKIMEEAGITYTFPDWAGPWDK